MEPQAQADRGRIWTLVLASVGDYWLAEQDADRAVTYYQRAIALAPREANGYTGMGDRFEKADQVDEAEAWYR